VRIIESARDHGVEDEDMLHVLRHARTYLRRDEDVVIAIGSSRSGAPLEVGVVDIEGDDPVVIHAMKLRRTWLRYLGGW
jgi:hypothetical protein